MWQACSWAGRRPLGEHSRGAGACRHRGRGRMSCTPAETQTWAPAPPRSLQRNRGQLRPCAAVVAAAGELALGAAAAGARSPRLGAAPDLRDTSLRDAGETQRPRRRQSAGPRLLPELEPGPEPGPEPEPEPEREHEPGPEPEQLAQKPPPAVHSTPRGAGGCLPLLSLGALQMTREGPARAQLQALQSPGMQKRTR
mmetsp:Transcript_10422/g.40537  ORF Transcript_10422/g.40537 Transcript_10422/m.40537 type:complete len:197 (-) Transcript_10422:636-1226(-)